MRVLTEGGEDASALIRAVFGAGRARALPLVLSVDPRASPGRYRMELVPARRDVPAMEVVLVVTGPAGGPGDARPGRRLREKKVEDGFEYGNPEGSGTLIGG